MRNARRPFKAENEEEEEEEKKEDRFYARRLCYFFPSYTVRLSVLLSLSLSLLSTGFAIETTIFPVRLGGLGFSSVAIAIARTVAICGRSGVSHRRRRERARAPIKCIINRSAKMYYLRDSARDNGGVRGGRGVYSLGRRLGASLKIIASRGRSHLAIANLSKRAARA